MTLSVQDRILIEQQVTNESPSVGAAYILWFLFGGLGGHRFYLGRTGSALVMLALFVLGWLTLWVMVGFALLFVVAVWTLTDALAIPGIVREKKEEIRRRYTANAEQQALAPMPRVMEKPIAKTGIACSNCGRFVTKDQILCECGMSVDRRGL